MSEPLDAGLGATVAAISELESKFQRLVEESSNDKQRFDQLNEEINERHEEAERINMSERARRLERNMTREAIQALRRVCGEKAPATPNGLPLVSQESSTGQFIPPCLPVMPVVNQAPHNVATTDVASTRHLFEQEVIVIEDDDAVVPGNPSVQQYIKPPDAIHGHFPTVVNIAGIWKEIWCKGCGANTKSGTSTYFRGIRGIRIHFIASHGAKGFFPAPDECCKMRNVSDSDAELMAQGRAPQDVAIVARAAPETSSEPRRPVGQGSYSGQAHCE